MRKTINKPVINTNSPGLVPRPHYSKRRKRFGSRDPTTATSIAQLDDEIEG